MPAPLDPAVREAIEADLRAGTKGRNQIARDHHVSSATVTKLGKQLEALGEAPACDRSQTKRATEATVEAAKDLRAALAKGLMTTATRIADSFEATVWEEVGEKDRAIVLGILVDKASVLTRDDSEGLAAVDAWLKAITGIDG